MRFVPEDELAKTAFASHEKLFLDMWYGLTHRRSLDSYRVRCLNSRVALRELCEEIEIGRLDDSEFRGICEETASLLEKDPVVAANFPRGVHVLLPILKEPPNLPGSSQKKEKEKTDNEGRLRNLKFAAADLAAALDQRYFPAACNQLREAMDRHDVDSVVTLTHSILSDLVAQGWTLGALFSWYGKFVADDGKSFQKNLNFMLRQLQRPPESFQVTLRISGGEKFQEITSYGEFTISTHSGIESDKPHVKRFANEDEYTTFAKGEFESVDLVSAAIRARDELEPLIDALRFESEPRLLEIDKRSYVVRSSDARSMLVHVSNPVPNPVERRDQDGFNSFSQKLASILTSQTVEQESRNRIETALRRYRFGRDSHNYSDKFLHWWMGLEALAAVGGSKIGRAVTENVSHSMLTGYIYRLIQDYVVTLQFLKREWNDDFKSVTKSETLADLDVPGTIRLLQDSVQAGELWKLIQDRPFVERRGRELAEWLNDPKKLGEQLILHRQRLKWQLDRLYRIRCCLVHGSPVRFRLALYAANLEYYIKQTLLFVLDALSEHAHVFSLAHLFQRNVWMWERQLKSIEDKSATTSTIADSIFASVICKD